MENIRRVLTKHRRVDTSICQECRIYHRELGVTHDVAFKGSTTTIAALRAGATENCLVCTVVVDSLAVICSPTIKLGNEDIVRIRWNCKLQVNFDVYSPDTMWTIYPVDTPLYGIEEYHNSLRSVVSTDTGNHASFSVPKAWLSDCIENHRECAGPRQDTFVPTRLLDVMPSGGDDRIILVEGALSDSHYIALSYCWGPDAKGTVTTKKDNLAIHTDPQRGIRESILPRTIRDAIVATRRLNIRYLWVDALCIIQDDEDDWRHESVQMCDVYQCSYLTIAADRAVACQDGFLGEQGFARPEHQGIFWTSDLRPRRDTSQNNNDSSQHRRQPKLLRRSKRYLLRKEQRKADNNNKAPEAHDQQPAGNPRIKMLLRNASYQKPLGREETPEAYLGNRAWALQEAMLPRRILHFYEQEMAWECHESVHCECGELDAGNKHHLQDLDATHCYFSSPRYKPEHDYGVPMIISEFDWLSMVELYMRRQLTHQSDKLVAVDGLARMVERALISAAEAKEVPSSPAPAPAPAASTLTGTMIRPTYVEGLFVSEFAQQLLWRIEDGYEASYTPARHRLEQLQNAPSWSWASVNTYITFADGISFPLSKSFCIDIRGFAQYPVVATMSGRATVMTGVRLSACVAPAVMRTVDLGNSYKGNVPTVPRVTRVRTSNGYTCETIVDDALDADLFDDSPAFPCWVGKNSHESYNSDEWDQWLRQYGDPGDTEIDNAVTRSCGFQSPASCQPRWCSKCRVLPSLDEAWHSIDQHESASTTASLPSELCLVLQIATAGLREENRLFIVLKPSKKVVGAWERVGSGRWLETKDVSPDSDPFKDGRKREILLV